MFISCYLVIISEKDNNNSDNEQEIEILIPKKQTMRTDWFALFYIPIFTTAS